MWKFRTPSWFVQILTLGAVFAKAYQLYAVAFFHKLNGEVIWIVLMPNYKCLVESMNILFLLWAMDCAIIQELEYNIWAVYECRLWSMKRFKLFLSFGGVRH